MTSRKLGIALVIWLSGVALLGSGYYFSELKRDSDESIVGEVIEGKPIVVEKSIIMHPEDLGQPSSGTTHIQQSISLETDNPYSMTDGESVSNYMASAEGRFLEMLFARLNSSTDTVVTQPLINLSETELSSAIQISSELQRMFYGYRPGDNPERFLYDRNIMHQFRPHADLLHYVQRVRPDGKYKAQMRGSILPRVSNAKSTREKIAFGERKVMYLVRQSTGTCLIESTGPATKYFEVAFQLNLGIPYDVETVGYPLLLWPRGIQMTIKPIDFEAWEVDKMVYFVKG